MKPDYGIYLNQSKVKADVVHNFYKVPIDHLIRVDAKTLTTMIHLTKAGVEYAITFDFPHTVYQKLVHFVDAADKAKMAIWLSNNQLIHSSFDLSAPFYVSSISAVLAAPQQGSHGEWFIPLNVQDMS